MGSATVLFLYFLGTSYVSMLTCTRLLIYFMSSNKKLKPIIFTKWTMKDKKSVLYNKFLIKVIQHNNGFFYISIENNKIYVEL